MPMSLEKLRRHLTPALRTWRCAGVRTRPSNRSRTCGMTIPGLTSPARRSGGGQVIPPIRRRTAFAHCGSNGNHCIDAVQTAITETHRTCASSPMRTRSSSRDRQAHAHRVGTKAALYITPGRTAKSRAGQTLSNPSGLSRCRQPRKVKKEGRPTAIRRAASHKSR